MINITKKLNNNLIAQLSLNEHIFSIDIQTKPITCSMCKLHIKHLIHKNNLLLGCGCTNKLSIMYGYLIKQFGLEYFINAANKYFGLSDKLFNEKEYLAEIKHKKELNKQKLLKEKQRTQALMKEKANHIYYNEASIGKDSNYLKKKGLFKYIRLYKQYNNKLVIPIKKNNEIHSLQFIDNETGDKKHLKGGLSVECSHEIDFFNETLDKIILCEGFATGLSLHEMHKCKVIVCFDCNNLVHVAKYISNNLNQYKKDVDFIIGADNDVISGIGYKKALIASKYLNAEILMPEPINNKSTDWNDYMLYHQGE